MQVDNRTTTRTADERTGERADDPAMSRVLVVGDDLALARTVAINLRAHGYDVTVVADAPSALVEIDRFVPAVIVLDLGALGHGAAEVVGPIRRSSTVPLIVLSGRSTSAEGDTAIAAGADDYLTKPFQMRELLSVVRAAERRAAPSFDNESEVVVTQHFTIDLGDGQVTKNGTPIPLTPTEWQLLALLVRHAGTMVTRNHLLTEVWGPGFAAETNVLRVGVAQLRGKLEPDPSHPRHLITEAGVGYRFER